MEFIDRQTEIAIVHDHLTRRGSGLFVLYGRRRIGKTALLEHVLNDLPPAAYHVATRSTITDELARLSQSVAQGWGMALLEAHPLSSTDALMALLSEVRDPAVLVLDEFPWLVESDPTLPGLLQAAWDKAIQHSELKLVVCGSSVSMMEQILFSSRSPLYGRRTGQLRLGPLPVRELSQVFPWPPLEVIELAALFGGVPGYLRHLDPSIGLIENLTRFVLKRGEPLYEEVPFLLREELREPRVYYAILAAIAGGARKFGEISSKVGLDRANLTRYIGTLNELGLVEREVSVMEHMPDKSRKGLYRIIDPFVATWFALVAPLRDAIERGIVDALFNAEVYPRVTRLLPTAVEDVIRELLREGDLEARPPFDPVFVGRHWSPTAEFDTVLLSATRDQALIAEVKWTNQPVSFRTLDDLRRRVTNEPAFAEIKCSFCLVSRAGFVDERELKSDEHIVDISALTWNP